MNPIIKNILAVVFGFIVGNMVNFALINVGPMIIPPPEGGDVTSIEGLKETIHLFKPQHFIFPFLAHALGTLVAAFIAAKMAANHKMKFALGIGALFLIAGIINTIMIPSPTWFAVLDVVGAYLPMGWLGGKWALNKVVPTD